MVRVLGAGLSEDLIMLPMTVTFLKYSLIFNSKSDSEWVTNSPSSPQLELSRICPH